MTVDESAESGLVELDCVTRRYAVGSRFRRRREVVTAVDSVSITLRRGQTLGLVGESGSGKTTTARIILDLVKPSAGRVLFDSEDINALRRREYKRYRQSVQAVFQDVGGALDPRRTIAHALAEPLRIHSRLRGPAVADRVRELLEQVHLRPEIGDRYPHELSGGMRQRAVIAQALALSPALVVLDEPVASLDVSIRAQIINLLRELQADLGLAYLLISHDLATVAYLADDIAVLYLGRLVETGATEVVMSSPAHPYTAALLDIANSAAGTQREDFTLEGDPAESAPPSIGCPFLPRCWRADRLGSPAACREVTPRLEIIPDAPTGTMGRAVACHFPVAAHSVEQSEVKSR